MKTIILILLTLATAAFGQVLSVTNLGITKNFTNPYIGSLEYKADMAHLAYLKAELDGTSNAAVVQWQTFPRSVDTIKIEKLQERRVVVSNVTYQIEYSLHNPEFYTVPLTMPPGPAHYDCTATVYRLLEMSSGHLKLQVGTPIETQWTEKGCFEDDPRTLVLRAEGWPLDNQFWTATNYITTNYVITNLNLVELRTVTNYFPSYQRKTFYEVYFSPHGDCTKAITNEIAKATNSVLVQAYSFSSDPITLALKEAANRDIKVSILRDGGQGTAPYAQSTIQLLRSTQMEAVTPPGAGTRALGMVRYNKAAEVNFDRAHAISHNKVIVIDGEVVITGSFNFTHAAEEHNAENLMILRDSNLATIYASNWLYHFKHSKP